MTFGEKVKELRKRHRITQRDLAEKLGINFTYVSKIENDKLEAPPSEDLIRRLAEILHSDPEILLDLAGKLDFRRLQQIAIDIPEASTVLRRIQKNVPTKSQWSKIRRLLDEEID